MRYSSNKDVNGLIRSLVKNGWLFKKRSKHSMLVSPNKIQRIFIPVSPNDLRVLANIKKHLRNTGFKNKH